MAIKNKTGTKEWAENNVNIQRGCEHGCLYCYARDFAVRRFKKCTAEQWTKPVINQAKVKKKYRKCNGVLMFSSSHDITPLNIEQCLVVLRKLLAAGNQVLITSKPYWECVILMCEQLQQYTEQIMFRFTIGSMDDDVLGFWEPGATKFKERLACLQYAFTRRYSTSVSCEPYLDSNVMDIYCRTKPYITHSFWIGLLKDFKTRVDLSQVTEREKKEYVEPLLAAQKKKEVFKLYNALRSERLVMWKDSIREALGLGDLVKDGE